MGSGINGNKLLMLLADFMAAASPLPLWEVELMETEVVVVVVEVEREENRFPYGKWN